MPALVPYIASPIGPVNEIYRNDYFVGDASTKTFNLLNKLAIHLGETVQSQATFYSRSKGSLSVDNIANQFTTGTAPDVGAVVIASGSQALPIRAYDQNNIPGDPTPRVKQYPFYVGPDSSNSIQTYTFINQVVQFLDKDPLYGAHLDWLSVALALSDGTPGTYQPAGDPLSLLDLTGHVSQTQTPYVDVGDTSIEVDNGAQIRVGMYLIIEPGTANEEQVKCTAVNGNILTVTPLGFRHYPGALIFEYYQKCWVQTAFPIGASGGTPVNLSDIALALTCSMESRV